MPWIKMRIVETADFEKAWSACQMAVGCYGFRKRTLLWICTFGEDDCQLVRTTLEEVGSVYRGRWDD